MLNLRVQFELTSAEQYYTMDEKILEFIGLFTKIDVSTLPRSLYIIRLRGSKFDSVVQTTFIKE